MRGFGGDGVVKLDFFFSGEGRGAGRNGGLEVLEFLLREKKG